MLAKANGKPNFSVIEGDCISAMRSMEAESVDALVTDPPAGISFMSAKWDSNRGSRNAWIAWLTGVMEEAYRAMKPGAHGLVWALPRTSHWTAMALEDAGFEIRDRIAHHFGSGFPKSASISKHIDKMAGAKREVVGSKLGQPGFSEAHIDSKPYEADVNKDWTMPCGKYNRYDQAKALDITAPATDAAKQWEGWGTALKPSTEDWWLIRKPLSESSIARNVLKWNCGALNIDASRVRHQSANDLATSQAKNPGRADTVTSGVYGKDRPQQNVNTNGRWPSNLLLTHAEGCRPTGEVRRVKGTNRPGKEPFKKHDIYGEHVENGGNYPSTFTDPDGTEAVEGWECVDGCPIREMDEQSGNRPGSHKQTPTHSTNAAFGGGRYDNTSNYSDKGGASRFFQQFTPDTSPGFKYVAKASRTERNKGLEGMEEREHQTHNHLGRDMSKPTNAMGEGERKRVERGEVAMRPSANNHPTVKPIMLMRYLAKLVCPPNGTILDPFCGSGSTGCAAVQEGFSFIGIEMEAEYAEIARRRIAYWSQPEEKHGSAPPQPDSTRLDTSSQSSNRLESSREGSLF